MSMIADVFDVLLIDNKTGEEFASTTMQDANIEIVNDSTDVEGGGHLVAILHSPKRENITLTDVSFHFDILAKQLGSDIKVGESEAYAFPREYIAEKDEEGAVSIKLARLPKNPESVKITKDREPIVPSNYTVAGEIVSFTGDTIAEGDIINVGSYKFATDSKAETIVIDNTKYPKGVTCVLKTLEISDQEVPEYDLQIILDRCQFTDNVTISTNTKRDAARHNINLTVLNKLNNKIAGKVIRTPYVDEDAE